MTPDTSAPFLMHPEVRDALAGGHPPLVALETSIVAQGLPAPDNLDVGRAMVQAVRQTGAVPALTAVVDGHPRVGLDDADLARLAGAPPGAVAKVSARDLAQVAITGGLGATTVAGTLRLAALTGIAVMATGGLGGVHPNFAERPDVSADLGELARSPVVVVCAGAKSILDLGATLEMLETLSVPIWGWRTTRLPAFYVADGGFSVIGFDDLGPLALAIRRHWALAGKGVVVVQPSPEALDAHDVARWTAAAEREARTSGVGGPARSPFVLQALARLSEGRTVAANRALVLANARLAGQLALALDVPVA